MIQNYPNPFNPATTIQYTLNQMSAVILTVHDLMGHEVALLDEGIKTAGLHRVQFDASHLSNGVYFYQLETDSQVLTRKMLLMK
ncbi:T9SS type A sorting domain-containing protein [bacterium]